MATIKNRVGVPIGVRVWDIIWVSNRVGVMVTVCHIG